jgi:hypothetical protein
LSKAKGGIMKKESCFIMGLPDAGKTSFLAALWYSLDSKANNVLKIKRYDDNHTYLSTISKAWADGIPVSRTKRDFEEHEIRLLLAHGDDAFEITFPDLSGETFQHQYEDREIGNSLMEYIQNSSSMLLFINPEKIIEPTLISTIPQHILIEPEHDMPIQQYKERVPREDDSTQAQLVELLQFVMYIRNNAPIRLGIIVSAWDFVEISMGDKSPKDVIKAILPLLWQYVTSNKHLFTTEYFGVSAQGGTLEDSKIRDSLLEKIDPCDRIIVIDEQKKRHNDITLPLYKIAGEGLDH